jgi:hypothetical protein
MNKTSSHRNQNIIATGWFGRDDEALVEYSAIDLGNDRIELVALVHQHDKATNTDYTFTLIDKVVEAAYVEDEAVDVEWDGRNFLEQLGMHGCFATGRFSEAVAEAIDRATRTPAVAAE